jgi:septal ring factor EnvC (AmiA/AmiB activator)
MTDTSAIEAASNRLTSALDALDAAVERMTDVERSQQGLNAQIHALDADRSRLAAELDATAAQSRELETANREVARRLDGAIETIRSVLGPQA